MQIWIPTDAADKWVFSLKKMRSRNKYIVKEVPPRLLASRNFFEAIIMNRVNDNEIQFFVEIKAAAYPSAIAM